MNWNHVDHETSRRVLAGETLNEFDITEALAFANDCLNEDYENEDVSHEVYDARCAALLAADYHWDEGNLERAVINLRKFWSV